MAKLQKETFDQELHRVLSIMAETGLNNAAFGFSKMIGEPLTASEPSVQLIPLTTFHELLGGPENEAVGIYLRAEGDLCAQFMMVMPVAKALEIVDKLMLEPVGTTQTLGSQERSALAELGNLTGTFFLNAIAKMTGLNARPSPPAVVVDMVGAILNILLMSWDGMSDQVLMIQTKFLCGGQEIETDFWVIPDTTTLEILRTRKLNENAQ
jgi:chemotaxis protein CheC